MIALVDGAVVEATPLDQSQLGLLASFLCEEEEYCNSCHMTITKEQDMRWENEKKENGGYCDKCRDLAGRILVKFDIAERT